MRATVVIVNYNAGQDLLNCVGRLKHQSRETEILIIDNASSDGSSRAAFDTYPDLRIFPLRRNVGFARAVNFATAHVESDIMILLNPDTEPEDAFVESLLDPLETNSEVGAVAGTLVFESDPRIVASAGIRVHQSGLAIDDRLGEPRRPGAPEPVFGASGGAMAIRLDAFVAAGGFPDIFMMYLEDVDLAWRLRLQGWETLWQPSAVASHAYAAASGEGSSFKRKLMARNRIWSLIRCLPDELWEAHLPAILRYDLGAAAYGAIRDRASVHGRLEALARIAPRLCERRAIQARTTIDPRSLERWLHPPLTARELLAQRRLTARLAR